MHKYRVNYRVGGENKTAKIQSVFDGRPAVEIDAKEKIAKIEGCLQQDIVVTDINVDEEASDAKPERAPCSVCGGKIQEGQVWESTRQGIRHGGCLDPDTAEWCAKRFGISKEDVVWHHSGICYSRIQVKTKEAADKVTAAVKGKTVNGGYLDGMSLGGQTPQKDGTIEVYC